MKIGELIRYKRHEETKHVVSLVHKKHGFDSNLHCPHANHARLWIDLFIGGGRLFDRTANNAPGFF